MKYLSLGLEYNTGKWVYPEKIYLNSPILLQDERFGWEIKNENLKISIEMNFEYLFNYFCGGHAVTRCGVALIVGEKKYKFNILTRNFIRILISKGSEDGKTLNGTYKLIKYERSDFFGLIPENTAEDLFKTEISAIYNDTTRHFSKNMIPGHLYITKNKKLVLCVATDLNFWSTSPLLNGSYYDFWWRLVKYSSTPKKVKVLIRVENSKILDTIGPGTRSVQEVVRKMGILKSSIAGIYSDKYAGKDLGPYLPDDGRTFEETVLGIGTYYDYYFIGEVLTNDPNKKNRLLHNIRENGWNKKFKNPELEKLYKKLGL